MGRCRTGPARPAKLFVGAVEERLPGASFAGTSITAELVWLALDTLAGGGQKRKRAISRTASCILHLAALSSRWSLGRAELLWSGLDPRPAGGGFASRVETVGASGRRAGLGANRDGSERLIKHRACVNPHARVAVFLLSVTRQRQRRGSSCHLAVGRKCACRRLDWTNTGRLLFRTRIAACI
jgi:hypothetical protein